MKQPNEMALSGIGAMLALSGNHYGERNAFLGLLRENGSNIQTRITFMQDEKGMEGDTTATVCIEVKTNTWDFDKASETAMLHFGEITFQTSATGYQMADTLHALNALLEGAKSWANVLETFAPSLRKLREKEEEEEEEEEEAVLRSDELERLLA